MTAIALVVWFWYVVACTRAQDIPRMMKMNLRVCQWGTVICGTVLADYVVLYWLTS